MFSWVDKNIKASHERGEERREGWWREWREGEGVGGGGKFPRT